jgi:hypothetical protein
MTISLSKFKRLPSIMEPIGASWLSLCFLRGPCLAYIGSSNAVRLRVEAGSNTSTVTLRVVGGDENGSLKCETVPRDTDPRKTALARTGSIYKRQTRPLVREGATQKQDRNWTISRNVTLTLTSTGFFVRKTSFKAVH